MYNNLSPREKDIVNLLLKNYSNIEIAQSLNLSSRSIATRLCRVYVKFGISGQPKPRKLLKNLLS